MAFKMKGMDFGNKKVDLTKKPVGPIATPKPSTEVAGDVDLDPGFEDPIKIQKDQREGIVPGSQTFTKKKKSDTGDPPAPGFKSMDASSYIKGQMARKKKKAGAPNYKNPQDYEVFNWGNKATPVRKKKY